MSEPIVMALAVMGLMAVVVVGFTIVGSIAFYRASKGQVARRLL